MCRRPPSPFDDDSLKSSGIESKKDFSNRTTAAKSIQSVNLWLGCPVICLHQCSSNEEHFVSSDATVKKENGESPASSASVVITKRCIAMPNSFI